VKPIRYPITIFSGFLQTLGSAGSGMVGLQREIELLTNRRDDIRVSLFPWNTDASDIAESLWRYRPDYEKQQHIVIGYSYGGDRAMKFCYELAMRGGCRVKCLLLVDAVRRSDLLPGVAAWFGLGAIHVSTIVEKCIYYKQQHPRLAIRRGIFQPAGHAVIADDPEVTEMIGPIVKRSVHSYIDNDGEFRLTCLNEVGSLFASEREAEAASSLTVALPSRDDEGLV
jgi:hypothetical protein